MNKQENPEPNNQQLQIEDLTINKDQAAEVKGGSSRGGGGADITVYDIVDSI